MQKFEYGSKIIERNEIVENKTFTVVKSWERMTSEKKKLWQDIGPFFCEDVKELVMQKKKCEKWIFDMNIWCIFGKCIKCEKKNKDQTFFALFLPPPLAKNSCFGSDLKSLILYFQNFNFWSLCFENKNVLIFTLLWRACLLKYGILLFLFSRKKVTIDLQGEQIATYPRLIEFSGKCFLYYIHLQR